MKKILSFLLLVCLLGGLLSGITVSAAESPISIGPSSYYSQQTITKFSEGKSASLTLSVDELGTDWYTGGLTIVVNRKLQTSLPDEVWQTTGADGVFTFSFKASADNQMVGVIYRSGAGTESLAAADWAKASLQGDIKIEVKQNSSGVTALYLNGAEWVPHASSGLSIPDGYLAIATSSTSEVTVKESRAAAESTNDTQSDNGFGYYSQKKTTKFSKGESASLTISVDKLGTDWFSAGLTIIVNSKVQSAMSPDVWQTKGANGVFSFSFKATGSNEMVGTIYRSGVGTESTAAADWAKVPLKGDITIEVKQNKSGVTALYLNGAEWTPYSASGLSIPDGCLAIATTPGSKVTVKASQEAKKAPVTPSNATTTTTTTTDPSSDSSTTTTTDPSSDSSTTTTNDPSNDGQTDATISGSDNPASGDKTNVNTDPEPSQDYTVAIIIIVVIAVLLVAAIVLLVILKKKRADAEEATAVDEVE